MNALYRLVVIIAHVALFAWLGISQEIPLQASPNNASPSPEGPRNTDDVPSFSESWQVLGPFQIGTREASWGADPLEFYGGFRNLRYDESATFPSVLCQGGTASWSTVTSTNERSVSHRQASLSVGFSNVDWTLLRGFYGWAAVQFQGWARNSIYVFGSSGSESTVVLYTESVLEFWIDDKHYFGGDFYGYNNAATVIHLSPGKHQIDVRLVYDVRAMGGVEDPVLNIKLTATRAVEALEFVENSLLISDIVNNSLASPLASIAVRNNAMSGIAITEIEVAESRFTVEPLRTLPVTIAPGQTKPIAFEISSANVVEATSLNLILRYAESQDGPASSIMSTLSFRRRDSIYEPHKVTHLHSSGVVSYAMLRPPSSSADCAGGRGSDVSILVNLHGAGVEAENPALANSFDSLPDICAWLIFPSGVTTWSDDWHIWGFHDVEAAISSIPIWIERFRWTEYSVHLNSWLVSGHSNGGQGVWYAIMHYPDRIIAGTPLSAYVSIQNYVPFNLWHPASPEIKFLLEASLNAYSHQMLVENAKGIPILEQHGGVDDNVPAYHSRLMWKQLLQAESSVELSELAGVGHWFDEVMTTPALAAFYNEHLQGQSRQRQPPDHFVVLSANPGDTGPKLGVMISQLKRPEIIGRVEVSLQSDEGRWTFDTHNVEEFELPLFYLNGGCITVDNEQVCDNSQANSGKIVFSRSDGESWQVVAGRASDNRQQEQLGGLNAILHSTGPFIIRYTDNEAGEIASQIAQNLYQYLKADSDILAMSDDWTSNSIGRAVESSNIITVAIGSQISPSSRELPIKVSDQGISLTKANGRSKLIPKDDNPSAIYLRPLAEDRLELVIWGAQKDSAAAAARLIPILPGVGQPDFVILSESCRWKGVAGVHALGFFDSQWRISETSYIL